MAILVRGSKSYFLGCRAYLLGNEERDVASSWASQHIQTNSALKWILGRYVEADNPNSNGQTFALEDLRFAQPTINHAPLNMVHQANYIVGSYVATEMVYPINEAADSSNIQNPFIEALAAFWAAYFPDELVEVQKAHDEGSLFFSMETVAESVKFEDLLSGASQEFPYMGPRNEAYGDWNTNANAIRWLNKPHFTGGALILPPVRPGWSKAEIKSLSKYMDDHSDTAQSIYSAVEKETSNLSPDQIEIITLELMKGEIDEDWSEMIKNSKSNSELTNRESNNNSDETASEDGQPEGGEMSTKTYSEEELQAKIDEALKPVQTELSALQAKANADAVEARLEEMKTAHETEVAEIRQELDERVIEAQTHKQNYDALVTWLEGEATAQTEAAEKAARKDSRLAEIAAIVTLPDDFVSANTDRWVSMSDEDFASLLEGYRVTAETAKSATKPATGETHKADLAETAMSADRAPNTNGESALASVLRLRRQGIDPRLIH